MSSTVGTRSSARLLHILRHVTVRCNSTTTSDFYSKHKTLDVHGAKISYYDSGGNSDKAVVFLHGNPTSSYLWRNVMPHVEGVARCLAPDLIGMGRSSKVDGMMYTFDDHYKYLSEWFKTVGLPEKVSLVVHDWGSGLGFHWANKNRSKVMSITHMESLATTCKDWDEFHETGRQVFQAMRSSAGEEMILEKNLFVERILPASIMRQLSPEEMDVYRKPFSEPGEARRPTLTWPREIPIESDGPANVVGYLQNYLKWLSSATDLPKLYIHARPGFFSDKIKENMRDWPNQRTVTVDGIHFIQEDSPDEIGEAIRDFLVNDVFK